MTDDFIGQLGIDLLYHVQRDPIAHEAAEEDQHREAHEEDEQEDEKAQKLNEHACGICCQK